MKRLFLCLLLLAGCNSEPQKEFCKSYCADEQMRDVQVCSSNVDGAAIGAAAGYLAAHFLGGGTIAKMAGAGVGAAAGGSGNTRCHVEKEKYCAQWAKKCEPNPEWEKWHAAQQLSDTANSYNGSN